VVVVASDAHQAVRALPLDDLEGERAWSPFRAYAVSKLANVMFAYALARRLAGSGVARTRSTRASSPAASAAARAARSASSSGSAGRSSRRPTGAPARACTSPPTPRPAAPPAGTTSACGPRSSSAASRDVAAQEALWAESERLVGGA
jgi:NAD(P)-dependent dehydrogenase (short-subunit alcohol dehydrogenase family)